LRLAERVERAETRAPMATPVAPPPTMTASEAIESAAKAAVAAAVLPLGGAEDVTIRPMAPKPTLHLEPAADEAEEHPPASAFIPPTPDRSSRALRPMPRLEDLPIPGQNELRAVRGETAPADLPEKRRMGLLQRLASVGLGRRDGAGESESHADAHRPAQSEQQRPTSRPAAGRSGDSRDPVSEYGKRHGHQGLDPLGRQAPVHNSPEEDQLEIPAFLRRQAT